MRSLSSGDICYIHRQQRMRASNRLNVRHVPSWLLCATHCVQGLPGGQLLQWYCAYAMSLGHTAGAHDVVYDFAVFCRCRPRVHSKRHSREEMSAKHYQYQYARPQRRMVPP